MQEFHLSPTNLGVALERREKRALHYVVMLGVAAALVVSGWALALGRYQILFLMPVLAAALVFTYRRNNEAGRERMKHARYELDENSITAIGDGHPLRLERSEVTAVEENHRGAMVVRTRRMFRFLYIRADVAGRPALRAALESWMPIVKRDFRWIEAWPRVNVAMALLLAPLTVSVCISFNPWVVIPGGLTLIGIVAVSVTTIYHQKGSLKHKVAAWVCSLSCLGLLTKMASLLQ